MSQYEIESDWTSPVSSIGLAISCESRGGENSDDLFEFIALFSLTPERRFGITRLADERFLTVRQEDLEPAGKNTRRKLVIKPPGEKPQTSD